MDTKDKDKKQVILQTPRVSDVTEIKVDANHCFIPYANTMQPLSTLEHGDIYTVNIDKNNYFLKLKHTKSTRKKKKEREREKRFIIATIYLKLHQK